MGATDGFLVLGAIQAGLSIVDSFIRAGQLRKAREYLQQMPIPDASKFYLDEKLLESAKVGDPDIFTAVIQGPSAMENISEDPRLRQSQMAQITALQEIANEGGYTPQERAQIESTMQDMLTRQRGAEEASLLREQSRGMGGSGLRLASDIATRQAGVTAASQAGLDLASQERERRLQALSSLNSAAGTMRSQEWGQKAQQATAADEIIARNIAAQNIGSQFNIQQQQAAAEQRANVAMEQAKAKVEAEKEKAAAERAKYLATASTYGA